VPTADKPAAGAKLAGGISANEKGESHHRDGLALRFAWTQNDETDLHKMALSRRCDYLCFDGLWLYVTEPPLLLQQEKTAAV
jgi:hypothetical protein